MRRLGAILRTFPVSVFPALLGFLGATLLVRSLVDGHEPWRLALNLVFIAGIAVYAGCLLAYATKFVRRPSVVLHDLAQSPARGSLSALMMTFSLIATWLLEYRGLALILIGVAVVGHILVTITVLYIFHHAPPGENARTCPAIFLVLVGVVLAAGPAITLGYRWIPVALMFLVIPGYLVNFVLSIKNVLVYPLPHEQFPIQAIHLAPVSLIGLAAAGLGWRWLEVSALAWGITLFVSLVVVFPKIAPSHWFPLWASYTFPLVAFVNLLRGSGPTVEWSAAPRVVAITATVIVVPVVLYNTTRTLHALYTGMLALNCNSCEA